MLFIGTAGNAILFLTACVSLLFAGMFAVAYAAHSFLVVLEGTANGDDDLRWPDEPVYDWLWKPFYLLWMVAFWLAPVWLVLRVLGVPAAYFYPTLVGVVWLLFPISLFSALSSNHFAVVWRLAVLRRMARNGLALVVVYLVTGAIVVGAMALAYQATLSATWLLIVPAGFVGATALLWYARLFGRLAWLVSHGTVIAEERRGKKKKKRADELGPTVDPFASDMPVAPPVEDDLPVAPPLSPADEWAPATPYTLSSAAPAPVVSRSAEPTETYGVRPDAPFDPTALQPQPRAERVSTGRAPEPSVEPTGESASEFYEQNIALRPRRPAAPRFPLWAGVYSFPWYATSLGAWLYLALWGMVCLVLLRCVLLTWPFG